MHTINIDEKFEKNTAFFLNMILSVYCTQILILCMFSIPALWAVWWKKSNKKMRTDACSLYLIHNSLIHWPWWQIDCLVKSLIDIPVHRCSTTFSPSLAWSCSKERSVTMVTMRASLHLRTCGAATLFCRTQRFIVCATAATTSTPFSSPLSCF